MPHQEKIPEGIMEKAAKIAKESEKLTLTNEISKVAAKTRGRPKKIDLSTAKVADAALKSPASVYEIVGYSTSQYRTNDLETYKKNLASMDLWELQNHAFEVGVLASQSRNIILDRLEKKFISETSKFSTEKTEPKNQAGELDNSNKEIHELAMKALSKGR